MKKRFGDDRVQYLPPPINPNEFMNAREINFDRDKNREYMKPRFLHIVGTLAVHDRNGTLDLLDSLQYSTAQFDLVICSQHELPQGYQRADSRLLYRIGNVVEAQDMYRDFDALILPRRYGGLSLTTNEALMSGLPVIMTDISPNNELLPSEWLVKATKKSSFMTRTMIDVFEVDKKLLAKKLDWLAQQNFDRLKVEAFAIAHSNFSESALQSKYETLLDRV
jgi:glycosyltransferase involved in cell wall biosynthesis